MFKKTIFVYIIILILIVIFGSTFINIPQIKLNNSQQTIKMETLKKDLKYLQFQLGNEKKKMKPVYEIIKYAESYAKRLQIYNKDITKTNALKYGFLIKKYSRLRNLDPILVLSIIIIESHGNTNAVSCVGAVGLMQVYYNVWKDELQLSKEELFDPEININAGTYILRYYLDRYKNNVMEAITAYNTGSKKKLNHNYTTKICNVYFNFKTSI